MDNSEKHYGRKRIKKSKPNITETVSKGDNLEKPDNIKNVPESSSIENNTLPESKIESDNKSPNKFEVSKRKNVNSRQRSSRLQKSSGTSKPYDNKKRSISKSNPHNPDRSGRYRPLPQIKVSIVIPAFNEEDNIRPLVESFDNVIKQTGSGWEVILVNDGSNDKTEIRAREAEKKYPWFRVISYKINRGLTDALNIGFKSARGSVLGFYPADLQYHPQDIPRMLAKIEQGADIVAGWKQGKYNKRLVSYIYNRLCRTLFNLKIHDMNSVKLFKKEVIKDLSLRKDWHRYLIVLAAERGFVLDEVKVKLYPRKYGKSKFGLGRILGGVLDLFSVKFQISFLKKPLRFFGTWGVVTEFAGILLGFAAIYLRFFTDHGSRTLLYPSILFILAGLMLFAIGFLAEVIVSLREEIESLKSR